MGADSISLTTISIDSGALCLATILRFHRIPADPGQFAREIASGRLETLDIIRIARRRGLKARLVKATVTNVEKLPLPAIAVDRSGEYFTLLRVIDQQILIQDQSQKLPRAITYTDLDNLWDGSLILVTKRFFDSTKSHNFGFMWFVVAVLKYKSILLEVLIASFCLQLFALSTPLFFQITVDKVLGSRGSNTLDVLLLGLIGVSVFESVMGITRNFILSHTSNRIDVELGAKVYTHLISLPMSYFQNRRVGVTVATVRELENIRQFLTGQSLTLLVDLAFTIVFIIVMALYSTYLALIVIGTLPLYAAISMLVTPIFRTRLEEKFRRGAANQSFLVESVSGIETVKSLAVERLMQQQWEEQLARYVSSAFSVSNVGNWTGQVIQLVSKLSTASVLYFGARSVMSGDMTVGELVAFNMLAQRVSQPVLRIAQTWQDFHQLKISIDRLGDILNTPNELSLQAGSIALNTLEGNIALKRVTFRYKSGGPIILQEIDLDVPAGQVVGIVGPSGSGKSTLTKLIQRLFVPEHGQILLDGLDVNALDTNWLRRQVGVVLQENVLFNRSVRDNIALTNPSASLDSVIAAAKLAGAHEFILELPAGYDTEIGERGGTLSGGQRQRIAIARTLLANPRILIFDEATSALDLESERAIQSRMRQICRGRTVLIIAHRLSAVRTADRILTIERGRIVEDGTHDDLMLRSGPYARLFQTQGQKRDRQQIVAN
jgi:subfamily B ATP-binding cassette protein HlyB/CyaB